MIQTPLRKLAVLLHADVVGSTSLVQKSETLAHERILDTFRRFSGAISDHGGTAHEIRGDALVAEFARASDAVSASVAFQAANTIHCEQLSDEIRPVLRIGIAMGEVVVADSTVTGEGIVLAQRLEQLAEPGGVVVQGSVSETVPTRLPFDFESLGEQSLKGFDQPVRAFVARLRAGEDLPVPEAGTISHPVDPKDLQGSGKPSIAVLPFTNMSGDPEQEYFADGVTEDLITELSRFQSLHVIARNSSFTYKAKSVKVQDVGLDLGVQYVVEGSVRKAGERIRVTVQLVEAKSGSHLWAEKYDRKLTDIFDLQDELTHSIVATVSGRLEIAIVDQLKSKRPSDLNAYDCVIRAKQYHHRDSYEDNREALELLDKAIRLEPGFAAAYGWKACTIGQAWARGYREFTQDDWEMALELIRKGISEDQNDIECTRISCEIHMKKRQFEDARRCHEKAFQLNPNDPRIVAQRGDLEIWQGMHEEGITWVQLATQLDPLGADHFAHLQGRALFGLRRYEESLQAFKKVPAPQFHHRAYMAACCAWLNQNEAATILAGEVLTEKKNFSATDFIESLFYKLETDKQLLLEGLVKSGLPA